MDRKTVGGTRGGRARTSLHDPLRTVARLTPPCFLVPRRCQRRIAFLAMQKCPVNPGLPPSAAQAPACSALPRLMCRHCRRSPARPSRASAPESQPRLAWGAASLAPRCHGVTATSSGHQPARAAPSVLFTFPPSPTRGAFAAEAPSVQVPVTPRDAGNDARQRGPPATGPHPTLLRHHPGIGGPPLIMGYNGSPFPSSVSPTSSTLAQLSWCASHTALPLPHHSHLF